MIFEWLRANETWLVWLGIGSALTFVGSLVLLPVLVVRMAPDYFMPGRPSALAEQHPVARIAGLIAKNVLGTVLLLAGIAMLVMPGQGLLTMLIGVVLLDLPGKRSLERGIVAQPSVHQALNWIRRRHGREPVQIPKREAEP